MIRQLVRPVYHRVHDLLNQAARRGLLFQREFQGQPVGVGHISDEHLADPLLEEVMGREFERMGVPVKQFTIDPAGYQAWLESANYPAGYYGGGLDPLQNFTEKTLEHYVSTQFFSLAPGSVFIDIAACTSPFADIVARLFGATTYRQDLIYPKGLSGNQIGGWAHELALPDASVDAVTLHCSLEHFEGNSDTLFFQELSRVLRPGGRAVILPFYLAHTYTIHVDPGYNLLKGHRPRLDPQAKLRYCDWYQFFSRHYDPQALKRRVLDQAPGLSLTLHRVSNFREVYADSYLRWVGVFERLG